MKGKGMGGERGRERSGRAREERGNKFVPVVEIN